MAGLWAALAAVGLADPAEPESMVGWRALLLRGTLHYSLGLAARVSGLLSPQGTSPQGFGGQYLSPDGENFSGLMTTCVGHCSVVRQSSDSTLGRADSVWMHSRFS